jgi:hypothetical protein
VGINPDPLTFRELEDMAYGKRFDEWDRASLIAGLLHNDPLGARPYKSVESFNPFLFGEESASVREPVCTISDDPRVLLPLLGGTIEIVK